MFTNYLLAIIGVGVFGLVVIIFRHLSDLRNLDLTTISEEQQRQAKAKIIKTKLNRQGDKIKGKLSDFFVPKSEALAGRFNRLKEKAVALEKKYYSDLVNKNRKHQSVKEIFEEVEVFLNKEEFKEAEKKLIEIIARDKKNSLAYEKLGDLYVVTKSYDQAEEIFKYLLKLKHAEVMGVDKINYHGGKNAKGTESEIDFLTALNIDPKIASYYDDLAQIYEINQKYDQAVDCALKAVSIEPNSPKYLDRLIGFAIKVGDKTLAAKTFNHLQKINPENGKLAELHESIEKI